MSATLYPSPEFQSLGIGVTAPANGVLGDFSNGSVTATGSTTPRALTIRAADRANALDFGADPTGSADCAAAINTALATGKATWLPKGNYYVTLPINVPSGGHLFGDGRGLTNILVDQGFNATGLGVIVLTGVEDQSPIVDDLRIIFAQPPDTVTTASLASAVGATTITVASTANVVVNNIVADYTATAAIPKLTTVVSIVGNVITLSAAIVAPGVGSGDSIHFGPSRSNFKTLSAGGTSGPGGSGVMYPPAIISNGSNRFKLNRLRVDAAWNGIWSDTYGCGFINEIEMGALNIGLHIGQSRDFIHISHYHFWGFGLTAGNPVIAGGVYFDGSTVAMDLGNNGGINGGNIVDCCLQARLNIAQVGAQTWLQFTNLMMDGPNSILNMTGGQWVQITNVYFSGIPPLGTAASLARINLSGGTLLIQNIFNTSSGNPVINMTNGVCRIVGGQLLNGTASVPTIVCSGGGYLSVLSVVFGLQVGAGAWTTPVVSHISSNPIYFLNNVFRDASPGDVGGLVIQNDSPLHVVANNGWNGWGWTPPGVAGQYGWNAGATQSTVNLLAIPGHAADIHLSCPTPVSQRTIAFQTTGTTRWSVYANSTSEGGSNTGSDFYVSRYSDTGSLLGSPISIVRSTGVVTIGPGGLQTTGACTFGAVGFHGAAPVGPQTITGAKGGNAALGSLLTALANTGLITDGTTA